MSKIKISAVFLAGFVLVLSLAACGTTDNTVITPTATPVPTVTVTATPKPVVTVTPKPANPGFCYGFDGSVGKPEKVQAGDKLGGGNFEFQCQPDGSWKTVASNLPG